MSSTTISMASRSLSRRTTSFASSASRARRARMAWSTSSSASPDISSSCDLSRASSS